MKKKLNKSKAILVHLLRYGTIDTWQAITKYKATRLSSIIYNLRMQGYDIESIWVEEKNKPRYVMYTLMQEFTGES
jgi:hypothetical protein